MKVSAESFSSQPACETSGALLVRHSRHDASARSANPNNIRRWAKWAAERLDPQLLAEVQAILAQVKNLGHQEGLAENN